MPYRGGSAKVETVEPPRTEAELMGRAAALAGRTLGELAREARVEVPPDLRRHKGWVGHLMERVLGADAASRDEPDFRALGIELKTVPVSRRGVPRETTFVCSITLDEMASAEWAESRVHRKLSRVLWVPIESEPEVTLGRRRVGTPLLWRPSPQEEADLRFDWDELAGLIGRGDVEAVTAHLGRFLQVRPKAANSRARRVGLDRDGAAFAALPRGFYLRTSFTERLLRDHFAVDAPRP